MAKRLRVTVDLNAREKQSIKEMVDEAIANQNAVVKPKLQKNFNMDMLIGKTISDLNRRLRSVPPDQLAEFKKEIRETFDAWLRSF
jgi:hypothetical protein